MRTCVRVCGVCVCLSVCLWSLVRGRGPDRVVVGGGLVGDVPGEGVVLGVEAEERGGDAGEVRQAGGFLGGGGGGATVAFTVSRWEHRGTLAGARGRNGIRGACGGGGAL